MTTPWNPDATDQDYLAAVRESGAATRNPQVHPILRAVVNALSAPMRSACAHPSLQINDDGVCCDCGTPGLHVPREEDLS